MKLTIWLINLLPHLWRHKAAMFWLTRMGHPLASFEDPFADPVSRQALDELNNVPDHR